jgi:hypothetical protein
MIAVGRITSYFRSNGFLFFQMLVQKIECPFFCPVIPIAVHGDKTNMSTPFWVFEMEVFVVPGQIKGVTAFTQKSIVLRANEQGRVLNRWDEVDTAATGPVILCIQETVDRTGKAFIKFALIQGHSLRNL